MEPVAVAAHSTGRAGDLAGRNVVVAGAGTIGAGDVQWMTAGRGIVHSEMPEQEDGLLRGFQLWVNLPAKDKMMPRQEFEKALDEYYALRGWDAQGRPTLEKLASLEIESPFIETYRKFLKADDPTMKT